ncbi:3-methyladenine DNA glycosylase [Microcella alkalica]|uniref:3-methyladenine DNA glycosylase/8-oxoguanine DNA glycosylase n=1 Tax=Microcella alkalica TaxID=355930 RepID=A0A839EH29_9MICO|nr:DNA-3-methyladenine glycosylase 2 family protein [Microcella alkalica]MBA8848615.1 3-methyladenine DNA glycosylase/8-oxoguanine DNA glycosylase [Microcella alkalica]
MTAAPDATGLYAPGRPVDLRQTLFPLRRGHADPTLQWTPDGAAWRTQRTPEGIALIRMLARRSTAPDGAGPEPGAASTEVELAAWGPGAAWSIRQAPELLGEGDDWSALDSLLEPGELAGSAGADPSAIDPEVVAGLARVRRRHAGLRLLRTGIVLDSAVAAVLEQKVTGVEARRAWRTLIRRHGEAAPGPAPEGMRVIPDAERWRSIPDHDWHAAGVGPQRMRTIRRVTAVAPALERTLALGRGGPAVAAALTSIPGVGEWTAAEITQRAHGDADAISVGDFHLAGLVGYALTGERTDDPGMVRLLAPFSGHRQRVVRLIATLGSTAPRQGARMTIQNHRGH